MSDTPILHIDALSKTYPGGKKAVDQLTLTVMPGDICGFIGHNGAGKTTTIRCATGVMGFESGDILIDGHSIRREPLRCKAVTAYVPDSPDLYEFLTGIQYLSYIGDIFGVSRADRQARIAEYGEALTLTGNLGDVIGSYSHGMKQKLALIAAFLHAPRLLILDEPFVGLDPTAAFRVKGMMQTMCAQGGAVFFSTHVLEVAEKLCTKIAIIKDGALRVSGPTAQVLGDSSLEALFLEVSGDA